MAMEEDATYQTVLTSDKVWYGLTLDTPITSTMHAHCLAVLARMTSTIDYMILQTATHSCVLAIGLVCAWVEVPRPFY